MIRIGIDVSHIFWPVRTGVHRYTYGLINGFLSLDDMGAFHISLIDFNREETHRDWLPLRPDVIDYVTAAPFPRFPTFDTNPNIGPLSLPKRFWNKGARALRGLVAQGAQDRRDLLSDIDVFHAWHLDTVDGAKHHVVMIHDAYPLLNPHLYRPSVIASHRRTLAFAKTEADIVLVPSQYTADSIVHQLGVEAHKVRIVHHGLDSIFRPLHDGPTEAGILAKYHLSDKRYLLSVGYLDPRKNVEGHLKAFEKIASEPGFEDLHLVLVGPADARTAPLLEKIRASGVKKRIVVTGYVPEWDLPALYGKAAAFLYCSHYEGFGFPILEAMACGAPVITSSSTCLPEIAGDAAMIVDSGSAEQISAAVLRMLSDHVLREKYISKGFERSSGFTWEKCAKEHLEAYQDCLQMGDQ